MTAPTVVIMAAGKGTRMKSATPKVLHDLCGRPLLAWVIAAAKEAGAARIVVVDGPERELEGQLPDGVEIAVQEQAKGTADAVLAAADAFSDGPVVVLSGDVPLLTGEVIEDLLDKHTRDTAAATVLTIELDNPAGYGRVVRAPDGSVERIVETKAAGDATPEQLALREINTGVYVFDGGLLGDALRQVRTDNAQREAYLPDVLPILAANGGTVVAHTADDPDFVLGVNDRADLAHARARAQARINFGHMRDGVTIVDPAATWIDVGVTIGADTVI